MEQTATHQRPGEILKIKAAVWERDGNRCTKCGTTDEQHREQYGKALDVHRATPGTFYAVDGCVTLCRPCHGLEKKLPRGTYQPRRPGVLLMSFEIDAETLAAFKAYAKGRGERVRAACERAWVREMGNPPPPVTHPPLPPVPADPPPPAPKPPKKGR